ncbi:hypothetical protein LJB88_01995 [Erysipelotrichaceae bacterium OttesenSCG-928-M19]|nr:hypothetical protein [Erysipelotrichaceae bacterium OttesenSCG-928-M19]
MAFQDYRQGLVADYLYLPLLFFIKLNFTIIFFILVIIFYHKIEDYIGGADIKLIFLFLLIFPLFDVVTWLLVSSLLALSYALVKKQQTIRMFPFFLISYIGVLL